MMLSRVAESLFWIGRYMERAENVARLVDAARRMAALPHDAGRPLSNEWASILIAAGVREVYGPSIERADQGAAIDQLIFDRQNPSSVYNCFKTARENARAVRFALTSDCWTALNAAWSEMRVLTVADTQGAGLADVIDWIKAQSALFRGAMQATMLRDDGYSFLRIGAAIERTDSTARLLDVKYHVLLPSLSEVGSAADYYQWVSLLQAAAAQRAYTYVRHDDVTARGVAEFLILEPSFPRTVLVNARQIRKTLVELEVFYNRSAPCRASVDEFVNTIETRTIDDIFAFGLHEFLTSVIERNYEVANLVAQAYGFAPRIADTQGDDSPDTQ
ncbi:MAG: alpha-E domain-containing protein [Maricaulaceae bacterium]